MYQTHGSLPDSNLPIWDIAPARGTPIIAQGRPPQAAALPRREEQQEDLRPEKMIRGSIAALVTPMTHTGPVDYDSLERLVEFHLGESTDALVVASLCAAALSGDKDSARGLDARLQACLAAPAS